jgi:hypothetical protein
VPLYSNVTCSINFTHFLPHNLLNAFAFNRCTVWCLCQHLAVICHMYKFTLSDNCSTHILVIHDIQGIPFCKGELTKWRCWEHDPVASNTHTQIELLDALFSVWSLLYQMLNIWWKKSRQIALPTTSHLKFLSQAKWWSICRFYAVVK